MHTNLPSYFDCFDDFTTTPTISKAKKHNWSHSDIVYNVIQERYYFLLGSLSKLLKLFTQFWKQVWKFKNNI